MLHLSNTHISCMIIKYPSGKPQTSCLSASVVSSNSYLYAPPAMDILTEHQIPIWRSRGNMGFVIHFEEKDCNNCSSSNKWNIPLKTTKSTYAWRIFPRQLTMVDFFHRTSHSSPVMIVSNGSKGNRSIFQNDNEGMSKLDMEQLYTDVNFPGMHI